MSSLFTPLKIRDIEFKNRIFVSPMCQYSSENGIPTDWHLVHLGSRAIGGAALVMAEATAVSPEGRISPADTGIWSDKQVEAFKKITGFIKKNGAVPGVQLAHAGRKASTQIPWIGNGPLKADEGAWQTIAPSSIPFAAGYSVPKEMNDNYIKKVISEFKTATVNALNAGFEVIEIHMAHGYLLHQFLSPLTNKRKDKYGDGLERRLAFPLEVAEEVRKLIPDRLPLFVRISATDWVTGGWDLPQSIEFAKKLKQTGIDFIDCSTGGLVPGVKIPLNPGYQIPFAEAIRNEVKIFTGGVGLITKPEQAEQIIEAHRADAVSLAREFLRDPYWPLHAAEVLNEQITWPDQYLRAR